MSSKVSHKICHLVPFGIKFFFVSDFLGKYLYVGKSKKMREKCGGGETF